MTLVCLFYKVTTSTVPKSMNIVCLKRRFFTTTNNENNYLLSCLVLLGTLFTEKADDRPSSKQTIFAFFDMVLVVASWEDKPASRRRCDDQKTFLPDMWRFTLTHCFGKDGEFVFLVDDYRYAMTHSWGWILSVRDICLCAFDTRPLNSTHTEGSSSEITRLSPRCPLCLG